MDFIGTRPRETKITEKQFLQNKCWDVRQLEEYYMEWERLYYAFNKPTDTIKRTFKLNMPGPIAEILEAKFKAEGLTDLLNFSLL